MSDRAYPLPLLPRVAEDSRFDLGLTLAVAEILTAHGYPQPTSADLVELRQALFRFVLQGQST